MYEAEGKLKFHQHSPQQGETLHIMPGKTLPLPCGNQKPQQKYTIPAPALAPEGQSDEGKGQRQYYQRSAPHKAIGQQLLAAKGNIGKGGKQAIGIMLGITNTEHHAVIKIQYRYHPPEIQPQAEQN